MNINNFTHLRMRCETAHSLLVVSKGGHNLACCKIPQLQENNHKLIYYVIFVQIKGTLMVESLLPVMICGSTLLVINELTALV